MTNNADNRQTAEQRLSAPPGQSPVSFGRRPGALTRPNKVHPLWALAALASLVMAARLALQLPIWIPPCGLRTLTGIPCPMCGSTRSLAAISHLELTQAMAFNPLTAAACLGASAWVVAAGIARCAGAELRISLGQRMAGLPWWRIALGLALANWIYLIFFLPD